MRKMKRVLMGLLLVSTLMMYNAVAFAAEDECEHDWGRYMFKKVYEYSGICQKHGVVCFQTIDGYDCIDICKKCGQRSVYQYTHETHDYIN